MRVLGLPIESPQTLANRIASDIGSIARLARAAPAQLDRILELGEEIAAIGRGLLEITELLAMGSEMQVLGGQVDARGAEIAASASEVVETGNDLIAVLPTLERALQLATPLEGAIDRFGRFVDRLPGGQRPRHPGSPIEQPDIPGPQAHAPEAPGDQLS
jgi:hypothetical protein